MVSSEIIVLAHAIGGEGFKDMETEDIDELVTDKPLDDDDIIELIADEIINQNDSNDEEEQVENCQLTASLIREGLQFGESMEIHFLKYDPNVERAHKLQRDLKICLAGYKELYKEIAESQQQNKITDFLTKRSIHQEIAESSSTIQRRRKSASKSSVVDLCSEDSDVGPPRRKNMHLESTSDK